MEETKDDDDAVKIGFFLLFFSSELIKKPVGAVGTETRFARG